MNHQQKLRHYGILVGILVLATGLRFWNLDFKPLWLDEVITALFSLGRNYDDIPVNQVLPISAIASIFTFNSAASCYTITDNLIQQSTHPPLFFCLMHQWLYWLQPLQSLGLSWTWQIRALPAVIGVIAIASSYYLNRLAFSPQAGLIAAALMAVSPFDVYLSQEARHYTLPMLVVTLALIALVKIAQDLAVNKFNYQIWLIWSLVNALGFYIHYFCFLAFIAQLLTLAIVIWKYLIPPTPIRKGGLRLRMGRITLSQSNNPPPFLSQSNNFPPFEGGARGGLNSKIIIFYLSSALLPIILFIPWLPFLNQHSNSPSTSWLPAPDAIAPIYQTLITWILMVIALPMENIPLWGQIISGCLMLSFCIWLIWLLIPKFKYLWRNPQTHQGTLILFSFIAAIIAQFGLIVYLLGKDLTVAPRYSFIYYPAICALLGASLGGRRQEAEGKREEKYISSPSPNGRGGRGVRAIPHIETLIVILVGFISSICVIYNLAFDKPFKPNFVVNSLQNSPSPVMLVVTYNDPNDIALGLSHALAWSKTNSNNTYSFLTLLDRSQGYDQIWRKLAAEEVSINSLWILATGLRQRDYPEKLNVGKSLVCLREPKQYYRIGVPYQMYRCHFSNQ